VLDENAGLAPFGAVFQDPVQLHKAKHLLTHVLTAAVRRRWPLVGTGNSGETREGFFVDLLVDEGADVDSHLATIESDMRRVLLQSTQFSAVELAPEAARELFPENPIKHALLGVFAEWDRPAQLYDLDGVIDVCDCVLKDPAELRAISPWSFMLSRMVRLPWREHARTLWVTRISGVVMGAEACRCPLCVRTVKQSAP
jgi:threonyl-tRNA synthetase